jgi:hypothetical protein
LFVNLRTKNTIKRTADKLKPVPELLFVVDIFVNNFSLYQFCLIKFHAFESSFDILDNDINL